jgi:hypothetical protein
MTKITEEERRMKHKNSFMNIVILIALVYVALISFNSCDYLTIDEPMSNETTTMPEDSVQTSTDTTPDTTIIDDIDNNNEPSLFVAFSSLEDVRTFVQCTNAGEDEYKANTPKPVVHYTEACRVVPYLTSLPIPTVNSEDMEWKVTVHIYDYYYPPKKTLVIYYDIGEIRYSFTYNFYDYSPEPKEGDPVHTVELDGYSVDLYGPDEMYGKWYGGYMTYGTTTITVSVWCDATEITAVTLDHFDLLPLIPEDE